MPTVSVIVTCYNLGMYLPEALESAIGQTYPDIEVVLVDDGSTDPATIAVLDTLPPHPRLQVLRTPNQGVARARNYGIEHSTGIYILPLDADDRILPTYVEQAVVILNQQPEVGFVGCHYRIFGERTGECRPRAYQLPDLLVENVVPIASVYRRTCWQEVGGYCPDVPFEDWDIWLSMLQHGFTGTVLPEILFEYRIRPGSRQTENQTPEVYQHTLTQIYERHRPLYDTHIYAVLAAKDRQFAVLHQHMLWLEQQAKNWEKVAHEHQAMIDILNQSANAAMRRTIWFQIQVTRWRRIAINNPTMIGRARAVFGGLRRVVVRRVHTILGSMFRRP